MEDTLTSVSVRSTVPTSKQQYIHHEGKISNYTRINTFCRSALAGKTHFCGAMSEDFKVERSSRDKSHNFMTKPTSIDPILFNAKWLCYSCAAKTHQCPFNPFHLYLSLRLFFSALLLCPLFWLLPQLPLSTQSPFLLLPMDQPRFQLPSLLLLTLQLQFQSQPMDLPQSTLMSHQVMNFRVTCHSKMTSACSK